MRHYKITQQHDDPKDPELTKGHASYWTVGGLFELIAELGDDENRIRLDQILDMPVGTSLTDFGHHITREW